MKTLRILNRLCKKIKLKYFPTLHESEVKRYFKDGGDERFRFDFDYLNINSLVIDLGGYKGQWASDIYSKYNCNILIFEPVSFFYGNIVNRFKFNSKIKVFNLALGESRKIEQIGLVDDGSSQFVKSGDMDIMQFEDVAFFLNENKIDKIHLLKINIEGGEYGLLRRLIETDLIKKIENIHVQFHDFVPDAENQMNEINLQLQKTHKLSLQYKFVWENWNIRITSID